MRHVCTDTVDQGQGGWLHGKGVAFVKLIRRCYGEKKGRSLGSTTPDRLDG